MILTIKKISGRTNPYETTATRVRWPAASRGHKFFIFFLFLIGSPPIERSVRNDDRGINPLVGRFHVFTLGRAQILPCARSLLTPCDGRYDTIGRRCRRDSSHRHMRTNELLWSPHDTKTSTLSLRVQHTRAPSLSSYHYYYYCYCYDTFVHTKTSRNHISEHDVSVIMCIL